METRMLSGRQIAVVGLGDVGGTLAARLVAEGARVTGVRRGASAPSGVSLLRADLADPREGEGLAGLPAELDAVVACVTPDSYDLEGYRRTYLDGARNLAAALAERRPACVLWVSSTGVYGQEGTQQDKAVAIDLDETVPAEPATERGHILLAAEKALVEHGLPTTAVRLAGIYGPGRTALIKRALAGRGVPQDPPHWTNRIHRDDAVAAMLALIERALDGTSLPPVVIGSDGHPALRHEVMEWLADRLGVALRPDPQAATDRAPSRRLYPRALERMGFQWQYPDYRAGYEAIIRAMEDDGTLAVLRSGRSGGN